MAHASHVLRAVTPHPTPHALQKVNDNSLRVLVKRIDAKSSVLELAPRSSFRDLLSNLCTDSKSAEITITVSGQHVTDLDQPLHAYGFEGSKYLLIVSESYVQKLKGGMVCLPACLPGVRVCECA